MKTKTKWTIIGLLILMSLAIVLAANPLKKRYWRYVCKTSLRNLGKARTVYANDYDDEYTVVGSRCPNEPFGREDPNLDRMPMPPENPGPGL
jgi:hypothetical protein